VRLHPRAHAPNTGPPGPENPSTSKLPLAAEGPRRSTLHSPGMAPYVIGERTSIVCGGAGRIILVRQFLAATARGLAIMLRPRPAKKKPGPGLAKRGFFAPARCRAPRTSLAAPVAPGRRTCKQFPAKKRPPSRPALREELGKFPSPRPMKRPSPWGFPQDRPPLDPYHEFGYVWKCETATIEVSGNTYDPYRLNSVFFPREPVLSVPGWTPRCPPFPPVRPGKSSTP